MPRFLILWCSFSFFVLLTPPGAHPANPQLRSIADATGIDTYLVRAEFRVGENPPLQLIELDGAYSKNPELHHLRFTVTEKARDPVTIESMLIDGQLFAKFTDDWVPVDKFDFEKLVVFKPEHLLGIGEKLEIIGIEEHQGRNVVHLRGNKADLPGVVRGSDGIDFSKMDQAVLDLWVDQDERFIAKLHIAAQIRERGGLQPLDVRYEYSGFNEPIAVNKPLSVNLPEAEAPPALTQADVSGALGFEFTLPEDARVLTIIGATVSILTSMPLDEARTFTAHTMRAAGFTPDKEMERFPGEFYTDFTMGERTVGVLVFQVTESGATITVGALK